MRHTQKALQTDTAVLLEKLLHMFASFGRSALLKPRRERLQTDWPQVSVSLTKNGTLFTKFVLHAGEQRIRHILIHQNIVYIASPFTSAPAQMLFPLLLCTPRAYTGTSGCRRTRETSRKAYCRVLPHPYAARAALRLTEFPPYTHCSPELHRVPHADFINKRLRKL